MNRTVVVLSLLAVGAMPLRGQELEVGAEVVGIRVQQVRSASDGIGVGARVAWARDRLRAEGSVARAGVSSADTLRADFTTTVLDLRLSYRIRPGLEGQLGLSRRFIRPLFLGEDVGAVSIGVRSEGHLARIAGVWARGALLPVVKFNAGGSRGPAYDVGFGSWVDVRRYGLRIGLAYELQRVDRRVAAGPAPTQTAVTRLSVSYLPGGAP